MIKKSSFKDTDWKKNAYEYSMIVAGCFLMAVGFVVFISPFRLVPGGVYGIAITLHHLTDALPIGIFALFFDVPLFLIGTWLLGRRFGIKTLVGIFSLSGFTTLLESLYGYEPLVTDDYFLASVFGGILIGIGVGFVFKSRATSGGTDIIALIINKYYKISVGKLIIYVDTAVVLVGLIAFQDWRIPLYSWVTIFITGKIVDTMIEGVRTEKAVYIISDHYEQIRDKIINEINRGGTYFNGEGMYNGTEKKIIYTIVDRKELIMLQRYVHEIDPKAFMAVIDSTETLGEGFQSLKEKINA
ncbi:MAG: YitT family protein [Lentimicrobiaceae bacterium]|nr:YitT family protein [Lentimicrobiaceae bacterium]